MLGHREGGPATALLGILQHGLNNTTPKVANSKLWEPEMRKLFCQRGSLTFIWKDTLELGGGQVGKPFQAKDSMCRGGEAGENVVLGETTAKCRARVSTAWERRIKKRGRVQILQGSMYAGGNERHRAACTVRSAAMSRVGWRERH